MPESSPSFEKPPARDASPPSLPAPPPTACARPPRAPPLPPASGAAERRSCMPGTAASIWPKFPPSFSFAIRKKSPAPPLACGSFTPRACVSMLTSSMISPPASVVYDPRKLFRLGDPVFHLGLRRHLAHEFLRGIGLHKSRV